MSKDSWVGSGFAFIGLAFGVLGLMYPVILPSVGWPITTIFLIFAVVFFIKGIRKKELERKESKGNKLYPNKDKAFAIQQRIDELYSTLWKIKDDLPADADLLHNKEIIQIRDELQSELNKLGQFIKDREYDRWVTHFVGLTSRMLLFHLDIRENHGEMAHAMINSKLRDFINRKVKGQI